MKTDKTNKDEGSEEEEAAETPEEEGQEGVVIPEDFQQKVHELLKDADKHHLSHIRDRVYAKEDELRKAQSTKGSKGKGPTGTMEVEPSLE